MNDSQALRQLDGVIDALPNPAAEGHMLDLMEAVASTPGGLRRLIDRYADKPQPIVGRALAFLLATNAANTPDPTTPDLLAILLQRLPNWRDESTLINCLTTLDRLATFDAFWHSSTTVPDILYPFVVHCLGQSRLVQSTAVALFVRLYEDGLLAGTFDATQRITLRVILSDLAALNDPIINMELVGLSGFLTDADDKLDQSG